MDLQKLEEKIGYSFTDRELLIRALTHTSYANEHGHSYLLCNERLEFLGDAVLELCSSEFLMERYPDWHEGQLSKRRASMVCEPSLAKCAATLSLPSFLNIGKGEEKCGGRNKDSIVSDALEAVIGAIYLDGGFENAKAFVNRHIMEQLKDCDVFKDAKTRLQEILQAENRKPEYVVVDESGPDHDKTFVVEVLCNGVRLGTGTGSTKKGASQAAATDAIEKNYSVQ